MDSKKISELTEAVNITDDNVIPIVSGGATQKVKFATLNEKFKGEKGDKGAEGNGILTIEQTERVTGSDKDNVVKITTTDGSIRNIYIKNGSKGDKGEKGDSGDITNIDDIVKQIKPLVLDSVYPIGSIFITMDNANPKDILGFGTWERIKTGVTLWSGDGTNTGTELEAGLPNIAGYVEGGYGSAGGAFRPVGVGANTRGGGSYKFTSNEFSATFGECGTQIPKNETTDTNGNPMIYLNKVYGKSETVQPPALVVNMWRRIA